MYEDCIMKIFKYFQDGMRIEIAFTTHTNLFIYDRVAYCECMN